MVNRKRHLLLKKVCAFVMGVSASSCFAQQAQLASIPDLAENARSLFDKSVEVGLVPSWQADATLSIKTRSRMKTRSGLVYNQKREDGRESERLFRFSEPVDVAGMAFLIHENKSNDDDIWMYLPSMGKTRRILSSSKHDSFVGSDFSYADLMAPKTDNYRHQLLQSASCYPGEQQAVKCHVVKSQVLTEEIARSLGYHGTVTHIDKEHFLPRYVEYLDQYGEVKKVQELRGFIKDDSTGTWVAKERHMKDLDRRSTSILSLDDVKMGERYNGVMFKAHNLGD